jgi:hypothetical protein
MKHDIRFDSTCMHTFSDRELKSVPWIQLHNHTFHYLNMIIKITLLKMKHDIRFD